MFCKGYDSGFVLDGKKIVGFGLGADATSEHEWGIRRLRDTLGMPNKDAEPQILGLDRCKMQKVTGTVCFFDDGKEALLFVVDRPEYTSEEWLSKKGIAEGLKLMGLGGELRYDPKFVKDGFVAAWAEHGFAIRAGEPESRKELKALSKAFTEKDIAIFMRGGNNPFQNAGLMVCIASRIPEAVRKSLMDSDLNARKLKEAVDAVEEATDLKQTLDEKGRRYYALSPRWAEGSDRKTKYPILFLLNPQEQDRYNWGIYTVEELLLWAGGAGPVIKRG